MKAAVFEILVISLCLQSIHAEKSAIGTFLLTADKDYAVAEQEKKVSFLEGSSKNMPVIDDIEIRIRNQAFRFDGQRYSLRVEPRGFGETRSSRNLYRQRVNYNKQRREVLYNRALKNRYDMIIDLLFRESMLQFHKDMTVLYEDKIKVLRKQLGSENFNLTDIIKAEDKLTQLKFENIERERSVNRLKKEIGLYLETEETVKFDTAGLLTVEDINKAVENTEFMLDTNNVNLKYDRLNFQLAESRYKMEVSESRRYVPFFEFGYDHGERLEELAEKEDGDEYDLKRAFIMNLGIRIPYINTDRQDINRRKLEYLTDRENYLELKKELAERMKKDIEDIKLLVSQYTFLAARESDVNAESSLKKYLKMDGVDPLILLSIRQSILENDIKKEKIRFDIYRNYIRVIDVNGQLSHKPLKNYLSLKQEVIAQ